MTQRNRASRRRTRRLGQRLGLVTWLTAACLLALPAGADPATSAAIDTTEPAARDEDPSPPPRSTEAPAEARAAPRPSSGHAVTSRRTHLPGTPSRRSVRAQIESIDPTTWLSRYGTVEHRELHPCKEGGVGCDIDLSSTSTETSDTAHRP